MILMSTAVAAVVVVVSIVAATTRAAAAVPICLSPCLRTNMINIRCSTYITLHYTASTLQITGMVFLLKASWVSCAILPNLISGNGIGTPGLVWMVLPLMFYFKSWLWYGCASYSLRRRSLCRRANQQAHFQEWNGVNYNNDPHVYSSSGSIHRGNHHQSGSHSHSSADLSQSMLENQYDQHQVQHLGTVGGGAAGSGVVTGIPVVAVAPPPTAAAAATAVALHHDA
jgi:hypothetical protein